SVPAISGGSTSSTADTGTPTSMVSSESMSITTYRKNGGPAGAMSCSASQAYTSGMRSMMVDIVVIVTVPAIATYGSSSRSTMVGCVIRAPPSQVSPQHAVIGGLWADRRALDTVAQERIARRHLERLAAVHPQTGGVHCGHRVPVQVTVVGHEPL